MLNELVAEWSREASPKDRSPLTTEVSHRANKTKDMKSKPILKRRRIRGWLTRLVSRLVPQRALYYECSTKWRRNTGETRHETARRLIRQAQNHSSEQQAANDQAEPRRPTASVAGTENMSEPMSNGSETRGGSCAPAPCSAIYGRTHKIIKRTGSLVWVEYRGDRFAVPHCDVEELDQSPIRLGVAGAQMQGRGRDMASQQTLSPND